MESKKDKFNQITKWGLVVPSLNNDCNGDKKQYDLLVEVTKRIFEELVVVCKRREDGLDPHDYGIAVANAYSVFSNNVDYDTAKVLSTLIPLTINYIKGRQSNSLIPLSLLSIAYWNYIDIMSDYVSKNYKKVSAVFAKKLNYNSESWFKQTFDNPDKIANILKTEGKIPYPSWVYKYIIAEIKPIEFIIDGKKVALSKFEHFSLFLLCLFSEGFQKLLFEYAGVVRNPNQGKRMPPRESNQTIKRAEQREEAEEVETDDDTDISDFI